MWIELIRFYGYGPVLSTAITLGDGQLNVLAEKNDQLKELVLASIWSTLYGFPKGPGTLAFEIPDYESRYKPKDPSTAYRISLDLISEGRKLRVTRDFGKRAMQVLERDSKTNITGEFRAEDGSERIGELLTGLPSEQFVQLCLGPYLPDYASGMHLDALIERIASSGSSEVNSTAQLGSSASASAAESATAITNLSSVELSFHPLGIENTALEQALTTLQTSKDDLQARLDSLERDKQSAIDILKELRTIEQSSQSAGSGSYAGEFNRLRTESGELSKRLQFAKSRYEEKQDLERQVQELEMRVPTHSNVITRVRNLWTRRSTRQDDEIRLAEMIAPKEQEAKQAENDLLQRYDTVKVFTQDEANAISGLAINLYKLQQELSDLQKDLQEETGRHLLKMQESSDRRGPAIEALKKLRKSEFEQVKAYGALLTLFRARMSEEKKKIGNAKIAASDIEQKRLNKRKRDLLKCVAFLIASIVLLAVAVFLKVSHQADGLFAGALLLLIPTFAFSMVFGFYWWKYKMHLSKESLDAAKETKRHEIAWQQAHEKITKLENRISAIALRTGVKDIDDFLKYMGEVSSHESLISEHESREATVETEEQRYSKVRKDLAYYFQKAGIETSVIESQTAMDLAQEINNYYKDMNERSRLDVELKTEQKQLHFLRQEIADIEKEISTHLQQLGIEAADGQPLDEHITELLLADDEKHHLMEELSRTEYDLAGFGNVEVALSQMEQEQKQIDNRLRELLQIDPSLKDLEGPANSETSGQLLDWGAEGGTQEEEARELKQKKENLMQQLKSLIDPIDRNYLETKEQLELVSYELDCAKRAQQALSLAKETINSLSLSNGSSPVAGGKQSILESESNRLIGALRSNGYAPAISAMELRENAAVRLTLSDGRVVENLKQGWSSLPDEIRYQSELILQLVSAKNSFKLPVFMNEPPENISSEALRAFTELVLSESIKSQFILTACNYKRYQELKPTLPNGARLTLRARKKIAPAAGSSKGPSPSSKPHSAPR